MKNRYISIVFLFGGILMVTLGIFYSNKEIDYDVNYQNNEVSLYNTIISKNKKVVTINLSFIGDSLLASYKGEKYSMNFQDLLDNNKYSFPFKNVSNIFLKDDFTIANGENVFTDKKLTPIEKNHSPAYWYYTQERFANIYKESSIEVVSVMNNHAYDYGTTGYNDTINALENVGVIPGGDKDIILEKSGIKIGLICTNLFYEFQANETVSRIKKLKEKVDYVIIYFHGGTEYLYRPTNAIVEYSHKFIDNGADLVVGCHPHVLQPIEVYKNKKIIYSLGSFLFGGTLTLVNRTVIYQLELNFDLIENKIIEKENIIPCYLYSKKSGYEKWIPDVIDDEKEKQNVIDFMNGLRSLPY